ITEAFSISAGLDYPGVGPEHSHVHDINRVTYDSTPDEEALEAIKLLSHSKGIIPALESGHAVAYEMNLAPTMNQEESIIVSLTGRGDKDINQVREILKGDNQS